MTMTTPITQTTPVARTLRTGELASAAKVNVETLRYYERRGLLAEPERSSSGYRAYPAESVKLVRFIKEAQELGFTLKEIEELLALRSNHDRKCSEVRDAAVEKIHNINEKMRSLRAMKSALTTLVDSCKGAGSTRECPILEAIDTRSE